MSIVHYSGYNPLNASTNRVLVSEALAAVVQTDRLSRPQVVKQLWDYIKSNDLQNPRNKREIVCDGPLKAVFGVEKIDMFKMNKVLGEYVYSLCIN